MTKLALPLSALALTGVMLMPATSFAAGAEACGNIELVAIGECHFEVDGGCKAKCEPVRFVAACDGQCNASLDASCSAECSGECVAACEVDPGRFDCRASCQADCRASIEGRCGSDDECVSYFEANCSAQCETDCDLVPPSASCEAECNACCSGSCEVDANFDCSLECSAELEGGCEVDCEAPSGALFCDGQYIAVQDLPTCLEYLADNFSIEVEVEASATLTTNCSFGNPRFASGSMAAMMLGLGFVFWRRRRAQRQS